MLSQDFDINSIATIQINNLNNSVHSDLDKLSSYLPESMDQKTINLSIAELIDESKYLVSQVDQLLDIHENSISNQFKKSMQELSWNE